MEASRDNDDLQLSANSIGLPEHTGEENTSKMGAVNFASSMSFKGIFMHDIHDTQTDLLL